MQQPTDSSVPIVIAGQTYQMRWDMNAMFTLSRQFGIPIEKIGEEMKANLTKSLTERIEFAFKLIYCMTRTTHPELTLLQVGAANVPEMVAARPLVDQAIALGEHGPLGKAGAASRKPDAKSASRGTGAKRSSRRLAAAG